MCTKFDGTGVVGSLWNHMTHGVISKVRKLLPTHTTKGNDFIQFFKILSNG